MIGLYMNSFWRRHRIQFLIAATILIVMAVKILSYGSAVLGSAVLGVHLLGENVATATADLEQKGFQCSHRASANPASAEPLTCVVDVSELKPSQERVYRVDMIVSGDKVTRVQTRVCGSQARPCPPP